MIFSNSHHGSDPSGFFLDHPFFQRPLILDDITTIPSPKYQHFSDHLLPPPPPSPASQLFQFPSTLENDDAFLQPNNDILLKLFDHDHHIIKSPMAAADQTGRAIVDISDSTKYPTQPQKQQQQIVISPAKKRSSKRDRHSKINTLRGPRDRRMRLSLPVARQFFGLQDMLRVDKASKTVEWLLVQARPAIEKLERDLNAMAAKSPCSTNSEGEVVSGIDEVNINVGNGKQLQAKNRKTSGKEKQSVKQSRKTAFHTLSREFRRAKARERTREKKMQSRRKLIQTGEEESGQNLINTCRNSYSMEVIVKGADEFEAANQQQQHMVNEQDCWMIMSKWSPPVPIFYSLQSDEIPQEHQFGDSQFFGKPLESYGSHSFC